MFKEFNEHFGKELSKLIAGNLLGKGIHRDVYEYRLNKEIVIKIETNDSFANVIEWEFWKEVKDTPWAKWFAPCIDISPNGVFLLQTRTYQPLKSDYPEKVPSFLDDLKYSNYGVIVKGNKKQFVCHDYGNTVLTKGVNNKLKKADWWE
jgi:hypothetical protein